MREINFAGKLTGRDFRQIQLLAMRKIWLVIGIIFVAMLVMNLINGAWREFARNPTGALVTWMPVALVLPFVFVILWFSIRRHWRNNRTIQQPVTGTVSEDGITWNVESLSSAKFPWNFLLKYRASEALVLVYQSLNQVLYFPHHYFSNDSDWNDFRELLASKLPRK
jgi:hypothetical protein